MFIKIPFESKIDFKTNISEIIKMSLEHDYNVNDNVVLGNFYVSGEYKTHAVSINKEDFNYTLPFKVELREDIEKDSLEFNIEDFTYEIENNNILKVNIEYSIKAELKEKEEIFERVDESKLESELAYIDSFLDNIEDNDNEEEEKIEIEIVDDKEDIDRDTKKENMVIDSVKDSEEVYVTYHIHIVKENETLESICKLYNISSNLLMEYNDIENMNTLDKLVIPKIDE